MAVLLETLESLFPLYFFILAGALLGKTKIIPKSIEQPLNRIVFVVFISVSLFVSVYNTNLAEAIDLKAILFSVVCVLVLAGVGVIVAAKKIPSRPVASVVAQCAYRTNFGLLGIIYGTLLFGADKIGPASILIAVVVPLFNILSVIIFEMMKGTKPNVGSILLSVLKNPIVIAVSFAMFFQLTRVPLPDILYRPLEQISEAAKPLSLIVAGSSLTFLGLKANKLWISIATTVRLLIVPILLVPLAILFGFRDITLISLLVAFGGPVATPLPAMAFELGGDGELAAQIVAVTSFVSLFTLHIFIVVLRSFGFW
ncbi:MAG: AEC family transporter [Clostridiaceae bacterium]|jgi:predicted permease|nr:AEC family transporter [Clostridiaceae bacterium]